MEKITAQIEGTSGLNAVISSSMQEMVCTIEKNTAVKLEEREVIPSEETQHITPSEGYGGLKEVTVAAIPQNYGKITYDGSKILVS